MKHIQTFESFLNEAAKNDNVITFKKFKDIDHTRLVKWMQNEFGMKYNPGMKWLDGHLINGGDFELDVTGWDKTDLADLKKYLKAQRYISESLLNESYNLNGLCYNELGECMPKLSQSNLTAFCKEFVPQVNRPEGPLTKDIQDYLKKNKIECECSMEKVIGLLSGRKEYIK